MCPILPARREPSAAAAVVEPRLTDAELVRQAAAGDSRAIAAIWARHHGLVRSVLVSTLGFDQELEDLIQEVFLNLFRAVRDTRDGQALPAILARIAVRRAGMTLRKRRVRAIVQLLPFSQLPEVEVKPPDFDDRRALETFYRLLDRLPARSRLAFVLHNVQGMPTAEVADALGVSLATAKRAVADGRERLLALARGEPLLVRFVAPAGEASS